MTIFVFDRITSCYGTPTMFVDMLNVQQQKPRDLSSLSTGVMAGASCPQELVSAVIDKLNMKDIVVRFFIVDATMKQLLVNMKEFTVKMFSFKPLCTAI